LDVDNTPEARKIAQRAVKLC